MSATDDTFEKSLLEFNRQVRTFDTFGEADQADRRYWLSRTAQERMKALEHIRQQAWGYDADSQPAFQRVVRTFQLGGS